MKPPNRAKLTKRVVDALGVGRAPYIQWDTELPGFGVRVCPSGRKTYLIKYRETRRRNGCRRMPSIGAHGKLTCEEARSMARYRLVKVARGETHSQPTAVETAFGEVAEELRTHREKLRATRDDALARPCLSRSGGIRVVSGVLPAGPANPLSH